MKILYLSDSVIPHRSAHSIHVMKMCQAFSRIGHEVVLLSIKPSGSEDAEVQNDFAFYGVDPRFELKKFSAPRMRYGILLYSLRCAVDLFQFHPDLVYGRCFWGLWLAGRLGFDVIYEMHFPVEQMSFTGKFLFSNLVKNRHLKHLVVISQALKGMVEKDAADKTIIVAHDGADLVNDINRKNPVVPAGFRANRVKVGYVGHLYPGRGIGLILSAARRLPAIDFHLIGGKEEDIKARKRGIEGNNVFFHGFVPPSSINDYILSCDILVMPYQRRVTISGNRESDTSRWMSPLKMFEYMASGKPIIASDLPVLREVLEHGKNAVLVSPDDMDGWVSAIQHLADNEEERQRIGQQAFADFKQSYTWEQRARRVL